MIRSSDATSVIGSFGLKITHAADFEVCDVGFISLNQAMLMTPLVIASKLGLDIDMSTKFQGSTCELQKFSTSTKEENIMANNREPERCLRGRLRTERSRTRRPILTICKRNSGDSVSVVFTFLIWIDIKEMVLSLAAAAQALSPFPSTRGGQQLTHTYNSVSVS